MRQLALPLLVALLLGFVVSGCGPAPRNLDKVDWADVAVPGSVCGVGHPIELRRSRAVVTSTRWPSMPRVTVEAGWNPVVYGDLDADGRDEAALVVDCNNGGGMADGVLAYAQVIFTSAGPAPRVIGVVTPQQRRDPNGLPTLVTVRIRPGKIIAREAWYGPRDATCCPSGRTTTIWTYAKGRLNAGIPTVERAASR